MKREALLLLSEVGLIYQTIKSTYPLAGIPEPTKLLPPIGTAENSRVVRSKEHGSQNVKLIGKQNGIKNSK